MATITGGQSVTFSLSDSTKIAAAVKALDQVVQGYAPAHIVVQTNATVAPGFLTATIYNVPGNDSVPVDPTAGYKGIVLSGPDDPTITATGWGIALVGNDANDTISLSGPGSLATSNGGELMGSGTVIAGNGNDSITVQGNASIVAGNGNDAVTVQQGNATISLGTGNDTITLGGPNDTVMTAGSATIMGPGGIDATIGGAPGGTVAFQYSSATGKSVTAGTGTVTLAGGSHITFLGGTGSVTMNAATGSGADTFVGGSGTGSNDQITAGGTSTVGGNVFAFDTGVTPEQGTHVITNFTLGQDTIQLGSAYDTTKILAGLDSQNTVTVTGGNTVISLDGGQTTIILNNIHTPLTGNTSHQIT